MTARYQRSSILNIYESPPASQEKNKVQLSVNFATLVTLAEKEKNKYTAGNAGMPAQHLLQNLYDSQTAFS